MQVIDLMLKNPRVPAGSLDCFWIAPMIQALHAHAVRAWDYGEKSRKAQAAFENSAV